MADTKISDLSAVTSTLGTDEFVLARSATTKKITAANLLVADAVAFTPAGTIAATDVQAAIEEVAAEASAGAIVTITDTLLAANANNFDFTSIPGTYKHLWLILYLRGTKTATSVQPRLTFNNDTGNNYDVQKHYATGTSPGAAQTVGSTAYIDLTDASAASSDSGAVSVIELLVPNYVGTTFHKTLTSKGFNPRAYSSNNEYVMNTGGLWKNTAAITRITITPDSNQWATGCRATLYGLN